MLRSLFCTLKKQILKLASREQVKDYAAIAQSVLAVGALILGGYWFVARGKLALRADISHEVTHRQIHDECTWVHISTGVTNAGDKEIHLKSGMIWIERILPLDSLISEKVERRERFTSSVTPSEGRRVNWPRIGDLYELELDSKLAQGEKEYWYCDYVIPSYIQTIGIYSHFSPQKEEQVDTLIGAMGWEAFTVYDLKKKKEGGKVDG